MGPESDTANDTEQGTRKRHTSFWRISFSDFLPAPRGILEAFHPNAKRRALAQSGSA